MAKTLNIKCILCDGRKFEIVSEKLRYKAPGKIYRCCNCGMIFMHPQMSQEEERKFYESEYGEIFSLEKGTTPEALFNSRKADARSYHELTREYLNKQMDCLEIGSASGYFLNEIKDQVRSVAGVESHVLLRKYGEEIGIKMYDNLDKCPRNSFDMIFMFFVLEHLSEPILIFKKLRSLLRAKGNIFIEIPNANDALLTLYDIPAFRKYYYTPAHQYYYTEETLARMLKKAGYNQFKIKIVQRYDLSNHMYWMMCGKPGGAGKFNQVFSPELNKKYQADLIKAGRGDTLIAIVDK